MRCSPNKLKKQIDRNNNNKKTLTPTCFRVFCFKPVLKNNHTFGF